ncbi:Hpt domain-containing protein [Shewanella sp. E94]
MLNLFHDEYQNIEHEIIQSKLQGDFHHLHRLFHTIKSATASLGEVELSKLAGRLEKLTNELINHIDKDNSLTFEQQLPIFISCLNKSLTSLKMLKKEQRQILSETKDNDSLLIKN